MTKQLPTRPDLDVLKREAKTLLKSDQALANLAEAQHRLAQTYGFDKWANLKHRVEAINLARLNPANWLKRTDYPQAIPPHPNPKNDWWLALANGDAETVAQNPSLSNIPGGPMNRHPLHYATCLYVQSQDAIATVKALLENGADPNVVYEHPDYAGSALTPLWGSIQIKRNPELAKLLLENGADPNDYESLYHCAEINEPELLKLLFKYGAIEKGSNGLARSLDFERIEQVRIMLDNGADPNGTLGHENMLCHAIRRNRSKANIELLLERGTTPETRSNEGFTPFQLACIKSPWEVIEYLKNRLPDQFDSESYEIAKLRFGKAQSKPENLTRAQLAVLPQAAFNRNFDEVKNLLKQGWPVDAPDDGSATGARDATGLLCACFGGFPEIAEILIEHGADINRQESTHHSNPLGWALYGSVHSQIPGGNHLECARLLIAAGVEKPKSVGVASDELRDLLAEHNYLPD